MTDPVKAKVVSIFALVNDWAESRGPSPASADYWRVLEAAKSALGHEKLAYATRAHDGTITLWSTDFGWSFHNPPRSAYRIL